MRSELKDTDNVAEVSQCERCSEPITGATCDACYVSCADCSESVLRVDSHGTTNGEVCASCLNDYSWCERCEESFPSDDAITITRRREDTTFCSESCATSAGHFRCADCDEWVHEDADRGSNTSDESVCSSCSENYFYCESCYTTCHQDYYGEDGQCSSCHSDSEEEDAKNIHCYSYKPSAVYHDDAGKVVSRDADTVYYGVELEVEVGSNHSRDDKAEEVCRILGEFAYMKEDSSISRGFEIVTHPATLKGHRELWKAFHDDVPSGLSSWNTTTCGLHIHASRRPLTSLQIAKIVCFVNHDANKEYVTKLAGRESSFAKIKHKKLGEYATDEARYSAVNLRPCNTIEFRLFKGNVKRDGLFRALEFVDALINYCKPAARSIADSLDSAKFRDFVAKNRKLYPTLHSFNSSL